MYFNFNNVDLVKGEKNCLIVDLDNYQTVNIDKKYYKILNHLKNGKNIEDITNNSQFLMDNLKKLETLGIGKLSEIYIPQQTCKITDNLDMVWLNITSKCNYRCVHCYENASIEHEATKCLTLKQYDHILKKLIKRFKRIKCVQITGGEPLLRGHDFIESLIKIIKNYSIDMVEIYSNLSLLDDKFIEIFKNYGVNVATSIYSEYPNIHDEITKIKGSHNVLLNSIKKLKDNNIPVRFGIVIMNKNLKEKDTLYKWIENQFGIKTHKHYDLVRPVGRANNKLIATDVFNEHYVNNIKYLKKYNYDGYLYNKYFNSCWGNKVCIKEDGSIYPCIMSPIKVGNYKHIIHILTNKNSYRYLSKDKIKGCSNCEFKYLCTECRAIYSNKISNIKNKPFTCTYDTKTGCFKEK